MKEKGTARLAETGAWWTIKPLRARSIETSGVEAGTTNEAKRRRDA